MDAVNGTPHSPLALPDPPVQLFCKDELTLHLTVCDGPVELSEQMDRALKLSPHRRSAKAVGNHAAAAAADQVGSTFKSPHPPAAYRSVLMSADRKVHEQGAQPPPLLIGSQTTRVCAHRCGGGAGVPGASFVYGVAFFVAA